uniref:Uncharacterized protein WUGSC:H_GS165O14.2 n=1 Tax=Homo sapiens TaxID=9606 RepID=Q7LDZ6_HUMAN
MSADDHVLKEKESSWWGPRGGLRSHLQSATVTRSPVRSVVSFVCLLGQLSLCLLCVLESRAQRKCKRVLRQRGEPLRGAVGDSSAVIRVAGELFETPS